MFHAVKLEAIEEYKIGHISFELIYSYLCQILITTGFLYSIKVVGCNGKQIACAYIIYLNTFDLKNLVKPW